MYKRQVLVRDTGRDRFVGIILERATETLELSPTDFVPTGMDWKTAPYLGPVVMDGGEVIQLIELDILLTYCQGDFTLEMAEETI